MAKNAKDHLEKHIVTVSAQQDQGAIEARNKLRNQHKREFELCCQDFWYYAQFIETFDEENETYRPFPLDFKYLHSLHEQVENNQKVIVLKARRLLISWYAMARQSWKAFRANAGIPDVPSVYSGAIMTIGQDEAEHLVTRVKAINERFPLWLRMRNELEVSNQMYLQFRNGGTIKAFPLKRDGPRTFGFSEVTFDEMAFQEAVRSVYAGMAPTLGAKGKLLAVSTPNGMFNLFHDIWTNKDDRYPGFHRVTVEWHENPEHDQSWFNTLAGSMDRQTVARELELSFAAFGGDPVYPRFDRKAHVKPSTSIIIGRPMYIGWDFGYHFPAALFAQRNAADQWVAHREVLDYSVGFDKFCEQVRQVAVGLYDREKFEEIHCVPPDGFQRYHQKGRSGSGCDCDEIAKQWELGKGPVRFLRGAVQVGTRKNEGPRLKEARKTFDLRDDGRPGAVFNANMTMFIDGALGGYCYPEKGNTEEPEKNEYCVRMGVTALTPKGWASPNDLVVGDDIYEFDAEKKRLVVGTVQAVNVFPGQKEILSLSGKYGTFCSTMEHRHIVEDLDGRLLDVRTKDLRDDHRLCLTVPELCARKYVPFSDEFVALCAWVFAEGTYRDDGSIVLAQSHEKNPEYVEYLKRLFDKFEGVIEHRVQPSHKDLQTWRITKEVSWTIRKLMPGKIPSTEFIATMSNANRRRFLYEFWRGDGTAGRKLPSQGQIGRNRDVFKFATVTMKAFQKKESAADALQMIASLCGINSHVRPYSGGYVITLYKPSVKMPLIGNMKKEMITVDGVWCPTTISGTWIAKEDGRAFVTGNSHIHDAYQMIVSAYSGLVPVRTERKSRDQETRIGHRTGM